MATTQHFLKNGLITKTSKTSILGGFHLERWLNKVIEAVGLKTSADIEITDDTSGLVLTSADGTKYRLKVDNDGVLSTEEVA